MEIVKEGTKQEKSKFPMYELEKVNEQDHNRLRSLLMEGFEPFAVLAQPVKQSPLDTAVFIVTFLYLRRKVEN